MAVKFNCSMQVKIDSVTVITVPIDDALWSTVETKIQDAITAYGASAQQTVTNQAAIQTAFDS